MEPATRTRVSVGRREVEHFRVLCDYLSTTQLFAGRCDEYGVPVTRFPRVLATGKEQYALLSPGWPGSPATCACGISCTSHSACRGPQSYDVPEIQGRNLIGVPGFQKSSLSSVWQSLAFRLYQGCERPRPSLSPYVYHSSDA